MGGLNNFFPAVQDQYLPKPENALDNLAKAAGIKQQQQQTQIQADNAPIQKQLGQQAVQEGAANLAQRQAINQAWQDAYKPGPNGTGGQFDPDGLQKALATSGHGEAIPSISKGLLDMQEQKDKIKVSQADMAAKEADFAGSGAAAVKASNYDPNVIKAFYQNGTDAGYGQHVQQIQQALAQHPEQTPQLFDSLIARSPAQQKLATEKTAADARMAEANKPTETTLAVKAAAGDPAATSALGVLSDQKGQVTPAIKFQQQQENYRAALSRQQAGATSLQNQGISSLQKQSDTYSQFLNTSQSLKNSLAAAKDGNEMAAAVAPLQGTLFVTTAEGVKRINNTELENIAGAGSLAQKINGELGKLSGKGPLSDQLKNDMSKLVDLYGESKYQTYQKQAGYTQKLHGLDPNKTPILAKDGSIAGASPQQAPAGPPTGATHVAPGSDGKNHYTDASGKDLGVAP